MKRRHLLTGISASLVSHVPTTSIHAQEASLTDVTVEADIPYGEANGVPLLLDIHRIPSPPASLRPAVLLLHGVFTRGYAYPSHREMNATAAHLATAGFVACSVGYRLFEMETGRYPWPAQLEDVQLAVRWLRAQAGTVGIDPERIGAYGHSNGGHLAALLGTRDTRQPEGAAHGEWSSRVTCVVSLAGDMDLTVPYGDDRTQVAMAAYLGGTVNDAPETYREASPVAWVDERAAPMLLQHGGNDVRVSPGNLSVMADALRDAGVEVATVEYPRFHHDSIKNWAFTGGMSLAFLARHLTPGA
jgi:acetyl esterase/lipase